MLHLSKVVIDGNSLYYFFFGKIINWILSWERLWWSRIKISDFFALFLSCDIQPYVVFNGESVPDDMKNQTIWEQMKQKLENAMQLANGPQSKKRVIPILSFYTFRAVLKQLYVLFAFCDFEPDEEIAILANMMNCPVSSNDSEFFILLLTGGFISSENVVFNLQEI